MFFYPIITCLLMLGFGICALVLNPRRSTNKALAAICFFGVAFFATQLTAKYLGVLFWTDRSANPLPWIRVKYAVIAIMSPYLVWLCYYVISGRYESRRDLHKKMIPWAAISLFLSIFAFTEWFKPDTSTPDHIQNGKYYLAYYIPMLVSHISVCIASLWVAPKLTGIRKLEFQFIAIALGYLSLAAIVFDFLNSLLPGVFVIYTISRVLSFSVYLVFGISSWSVTAHRIYHSSQVWLSIAQRFFAIAIVAIPTVYALKLVVTYEYSLTSMCVVVGLGFLGFHFIDDKLRGVLKLKTEHQLHAFARELHQVAVAENEPDRLIEYFEATLAKFSGASGVKIFIRDNDKYVSGEIRIPVKHIAAELADGWIAKDALDRRHPTGERNALIEMLAAEGISVVVCSRWVERTPTLIVGLYNRPNHLPYTHPEIHLLVELAEVVDSLYTRVRFALQARESAQLASLGRLVASIVHEIRNPMWTLKAFAQMLPEKQDNKAFLKEYAELIPQETERIEKLAEQLLNLAKPRVYKIVKTDIHNVINDTVTLSMPQVAGYGCTITSNLNAEERLVMADENALRQVFVNLIRNSSEAMRSRVEEKRIEIRSFNNDGWLQIEVEDSGPGLPREIRKKLFTTFTSSGKQTGLGLGLAISQEIIKVHNGHIMADTEREQGCLFTIWLPLADDTQMLPA